ncbi:MAG: phytoene synthase [Flavobacteriales bacterium]|nr:phytoene synthase [Flavobacteriales bacterium]|tara:strand:+ start:99200 stop:100042 length:843 start_codon:yes stop_codon:yes gene_type:complete
MKEQKDIFDLVSLECSKQTTKAYSTSFSLAIKLLNKEYRNAIYSIYGFVRLADEIVDTFHNYDKKKLLNQLRNSTKDAIKEKISLNPIINSFQNTVNRYNIDWMLIDSFLKSMEYDLEHKNCTPDSYKEYIRGSAEAVGLMCLYVFTTNKTGKYNDLKPYAESLGSAFQKINFLRDLSDDYNHLRRVYFPNIDISKFDNVQKKSIEEDIEKEFIHALVGIKLLDKKAQKGVYLAFRYYVSLFNKIKNLDASYILKNRVRISNFNKIMILMFSQFSFKLKY